VTIRQILLKYWGYASFRPMQEEIILSVMEGKDTLALLPTGGGKSLTFQVPALATEGMCLVITPLISLMKDQVDNLVKRGIPAAAIHSGMSPREIDIVINKARYGDVKLLYISPERLETVRMRELLKKTRINLLAVDEAHCISQWGYDFRPPYLKIADIRDILPGVPVLALTATATPRVAEDIMHRLAFRQKVLFRKSFERKNLTYFVIAEEDKPGRLLKIARKVKGPGVVYVRNRRATKEIATYLSKQGIPATYYHAGLDPADREKRQAAWISEEKRVIVATNAFGMGIDKPNVRFVVHYDLPDCLEAYFQEAGRAGRDEKRSFAILLYCKADIEESRKHLETAYPDLKKIRAIYDALGNFFQLPVGGGRDTSWEFDITGFSTRYGFQPVVVYSTLKLLEKEGYLWLNDAVFTPSRIYIRADKESLYRFQVANESFDTFIKTILRSYGGVLSDFVPFRESDLAGRLNISGDKVIETLKKLEIQQILDYLPASQKPVIAWSQERIPANDLILSAVNYRDRLRDASERLDAMVRYTESTHVCRSQALLTYFGEKESRRCGKCDVCLERNKTGLNDLEFETISQTVLPVLSKGPCTMEDLVEACAGIHEDKVIHVVMWMIDNGQVRYEEGKLTRA
jgi:ATP-dependent DNA helicase RecQ